VRLAVTGGGTGGGIYPALSVVHELLSDPQWGTALEDVVWVGMGGALEERIVVQRGMRFRALPSGPVRGVNPLRAVRSLARMAQGVALGRRLLHELGTEVVLATGGYVSAPLLAAAWRLCPSLIYLPDMEPGLAVRYLSPLATRIAVSFEGVEEAFPAGKAFVSGYPVRREFLGVERDAARRLWGLDNGASVLLVMGGSTGGRGINVAVQGCLPELLEMAEVIHVCGQAHYEDMARSRDALPERLRKRYRLHAYLYEGMAQAMAAADLAMARAGASTLAELPAVGLPAILVPYPHPPRHQDANARYLSSCGAAVVVEEDDLANSLLDVVRELLGNATRRQEMSRASRALSRPDAARTIASELVRLATERR